MLKTLYGSWLDSVMADCVEQVSLDNAGHGAGQGVREFISFFSS
jgi:hypothetical protein